MQPPRVFIIILQYNNSAMMRDRLYDVRTSTSSLNVIGKRHFGKKALPSGGGGGRGTTRELFDTLIYWQARVPLGRCPSGREPRGPFLERGASQFLPACDAVPPWRIELAVPAGGRRWVAPGTHADRSWSGADPGHVHLSRTGAPLPDDRRHPRALLYPIRIDCLVHSNRLCDCPGN